MSIYLLKIVQECEKRLNGVELERLLERKKNKNMIRSSIERFNKAENVKKMVNKLIAEGLLSK